MCSIGHFAHFCTYYAVSCELGFLDTTGPTGGSQCMECWGGPTNGRAAAAIAQAGKTALDAHASDPTDPIDFIRSLFALGEKPLKQSESPRRTPRSLRMAQDIARDIVGKRQFGFERRGREHGCIFLPAMHCYSAGMSSLKRAAQQHCNEPQHP